jgi:hypothetical protein
MKNRNWRATRDDFVAAPGSYRLRAVISATMEHGK